MTANVYSLEEALADSTALGDIAEAAGVSVAAARTVAAGLAALPIRQVIRICVAAEVQEQRRRRRR